ncbi:hypothetical protein A2U01_0106834, partial [Trifolium medium]|nr:hypothetical protein [Trifolium medium]
PVNIRGVNASVMSGTSMTCPQLLMLVEMQLVSVQLNHDGRCN